MNSDKLQLATARSSGVIMPPSGYWFNNSYQTALTLPFQLQGFCRSSVQCIPAQPGMTLASTLYAPQILDPFKMRTSRKSGHGMRSSFN